MNSVIQKNLLMKSIVQPHFFPKALFVTLGMLCFIPFISSPSALVLGFITALIIGNPFEKQLHRIIHLLLQISIVGLGFGLSIDEALTAGKTGFSLTAISISVLLILGYALGKIFKMETALSYLISVGTAICGGSAIAAVSPIIKPNPRQISLALAIVFTLNSIALFIYPIIGHFLGLTQEQFGLWCAIGIHDTSSVVGAASKYGYEALKIATTVKLARALWIIPISLFSMYWFKNQFSKIKIPWFIGLFIVAILLNSYFPVFNSLTPTITQFSKSGLALTLFLIGSTFTLQTLKSIGIKPLLFAVILWLVISTGSLFFIVHL